jgi:23S rRNA pseudouridine955/2504/2580 synthase
VSTEKHSGGVRLVKVDPHRDGQRLDNYLVTLLKGVPRTAIYRMIRTGQVRINGSRAKAASRLEAGDNGIPPARTRRTTGHRRCKCLPPIAPRHPVRES